MAPSAAFECDAKVFHCPIHQYHPGVHGRTVLNDETIVWLLITCSENKCAQAVDWKKCLKRWRKYYSELFNRFVEFLTIGITQLV